MKTQFGHEVSADSEGWLSVSAYAWQGVLALRCF